MGEEVSDKTVVVLDVRGLENDYLLAEPGAAHSVPPREQCDISSSWRSRWREERRGLEDNIIIMSLPYIIHIHIQTKLSISVMCRVQCLGRCISALL